MRFKARFLGRVLLILATIAVLAYIVMLLWNAVVPGVFMGTRTLDYRQALCLLVLSRILFGGFRGQPGRRWQRLEGLTAEERARFRKGRRGSNRGLGGNS